MEARPAIMEERTDITLEVDNLQTRIWTKDGVVRAVDGASFFIRRGEVFGLAGESGSGKSMTAFSILRLLPFHARITAGTIRFVGVDLVSLPDKSMRELRGSRIAMIFQDPMTSLNPVFTVGDQISEAIRQHKSIGNTAARTQTVEFLARVGIPEPKRRFKSYPHEFSGGMRQRVMIAMALACAPDLLVADEPTTALDVTIERQILTLLEDMRSSLGAAILLITHNLAILAEHANRVAVMYAGQVVEMGDTGDLLGQPLHPYTRGLLSSMPKAHISKARLEPIAGLPPVITGNRLGCAFAPRCKARMSRCETINPEIREVAPGHWVRCLLYETAT
jgi:peptide/nickel transport system ATP-binding protein